MRTSNHSQHLGANQNYWWKDFIFGKNAKSKENRYKRIYTLPLRLINQFANYHYLCTLKPKNIYQYKKPFLCLPFNSINKNDMKYFITFLLLPFLAAAQPIISSIDMIKPYEDFPKFIKFWRCSHTLEKQQKIDTTML